MTTVLIHKPEILSLNIGSDGIPILSPRLYRTYAIGLPLSNTISGVIDHLNTLLFVESATQINGLKIAVKTKLTNTYELHTLNKLFTEGVHTLYSKIWRVTKYDSPMTSAEADRILCQKSACADDEPLYIVYVIDVLK